MGTVRILVADDNAGVVQLVSAALARQGYQVLSATSPREALQAATDGLQIDLVLVDVVMPEMNGPELVRKIQQHSPSIVPVLMSGYTGEDFARDIPLVRKPFSAAHLLSTVSLALRKAGKEPRRRHNL